MTPKGLDTAALAAMLADQLPPHMMPGALITLDEMPLLFVGNAVDRGALPLPDWSAAAVDAVVAPVNGLEAQLQAIFQDVLGVEPVSTHADFFVLGGTDDKARPLAPHLLCHITPDHLACCGVHACLSSKRCPE